MLPFAFSAPIAGLLVDRYDRRKLMIGADAIRAVMVLGFLLVENASDLWVLYLLSTLQVVLGAIFVPARSASVPNITSKRELLTANALMAATWSVLLALGAAIGGFATAWLGEDAVFIIDSFTYVISAWFIWRTVIPQDKLVKVAGNLFKQAYREIVDGYGYMRRNPLVGRIAMAKMTWGIGGGAIVYMLALLGAELRPEEAAVGMGILFSARGLGTGFGPVLARVLFKDRSKWTALLGSSVLFSGIAYVFLSLISWDYSIYLIGLFIVFAHGASGVNWVFSTVIVQERSEDVYRGRVFSTEWLLVTLVDSLGILVSSLLLEYFDWSLRQSFQLFAVVQILSGAIWLWTVVPNEKRELAARADKSFY